jgi:hypothetical protein
VQFQTGKSLADRVHKGLGQGCDQSSEEDVSGLYGGLFRCFSGTPTARIESDWRSLTARVPASAPADANARAWRYFFHVGERFHRCKKVLLQISMYIFANFNNK